MPSTSYISASPRYNAVVTALELYRSRNGFVCTNNSRRRAKGRFSPYPRVRYEKLITNAHLGEADGRQHHADQDVDTLATFSYILENHWNTIEASASDLADDAMDLS